MARAASILPPLEASLGLHRVNDVVDSGLGHRHGDACYLLLVVPTVTGLFSRRHAAAVTTESSVDLAVKLHVRGLVHV
jgi:hypothetical protein